MAWRWLNPDGAIVRPYGLILKWTKNLTVRLFLISYATLRSNRALTRRKSIGWVFQVLRVVVPVFFIDVYCCKRPTICLSRPLFKLLFDTNLNINALLSTFLTARGDWTHQLSPHLFVLILLILNCTLLFLISHSHSRTVRNKTLLFRRFWLSSPIFSWRLVVNLFSCWLVNCFRRRTYLLGFNITRSLFVLFLRDFSVGSIPCRFHLFVLNYSKLNLRLTFFNIRRLIKHRFLCSSWLLYLNSGPSTCNHIHLKQIVFSLFVWVGHKSSPQGWNLFESRLQLDLFCLFLGRINHLISCSLE